MPTIVSPSMTRTAPMFFSAISLSASNIDAVGPTVWTVGSDLDRRIWATLFIGASRDKRTLHIGGRATLSRCDVSHVLHAPSVLRVLTRPSMFSSPPPIPSDYDADSLRC